MKNLKILRKGVFVTGTDTGVGKTIVTGLLGRFLDEKGYRVITQKWIQTGSRNFPHDITEHLKLMGRIREDIREHLPYISSYVLKFASSPHLAARLEKRKIRVDKIKADFKVLQEQFDFVIVEGIGGVLVPFNKKRLVIDVARELKMPVIIVVGNKLGAINHTLLAIEAVRRRGLEIVGVIFNNLSKKGNKIILEDNLKIIKKISKEKVLGSLPYSKNKALLYSAFKPAGNKILRNLISS
ncbi:MAG: dethiobiotin synthase [Candidatus Omnitrophica bacterium]|nr:dethiobiotin synthase [Candidatus Omnitrophota bacterium]MBU2504303.1 dethiobiotin synthase [Candidatus Omnitrophota bacterium]